MLEGGALISMGAAKISWDAVVSTMDGAVTDIVAVTFSKIVAGESDCDFCRSILEVFNPKGPGYLVGCWTRRSSRRACGGRSWQLPRLMFGRIAKA